MLRRAQRAKELREAVGAAAAAQAAMAALRGARAARAAASSARRAVAGAKRQRGLAACSDHLARQELWSAARARLAHLTPYLLERVSDLCVGKSSGGGSGSCGGAQLLPLHECEALVIFLSDRANIGVGARVVRNVHAVASGGRARGGALRLGDLHARVRQADMELELEWASTQRLSQRARQQKVVRSREMLNTKKAAEIQLAKCAFAESNRRGSTGWR